MTIPDRIASLEDRLSSLTGVVATLVELAAGAARDALLRKQLADAPEFGRRALPAGGVNHQIIP